MCYATSREGLQYSREVEGLKGHDIGATLIDKNTGIIGLSCDYLTIKAMIASEDEGRQKF